MRKHRGTPSRRDKHVTLAAINPLSVARGHFVGGHESGVAGYKLPPLFKRGASSCSSQRQRQREPRGASQRPRAPTYLPTSGFSCAPPLLAGMLGCVCVCVPAPLVPRHSWLGCVPWVCVLWLGFRLRPASSGWGVWVCACSCARSACTLGLLAGVYGVDVCAWARVSAVPRYSWLGCWGVCVFVCALRLDPATPGCGVRRGCVFRLRFQLRPTTPGWGVGVCVCLCARSACTPPLLAGVFGVGVCVWAPVSAAPRLSWLGCWGVCVFVCPSACSPELFAGVCGVCVCVRARVLAAPRHSWLGCWGVCVFVCPLRLYPASPGWGVQCGCVCCGSGFGLRPATLGWGVGVCVCLCARTVCTPPLPAGVCGVGVCVWARVSAAPRRS